MLYHLNMADVEKTKEKISDSIPTPEKEEDLNEEKTLFEWDGLERAFKTRDRDFWVTVISILVLVSVILIFIKEFFLIVALFSAIFLYYVLSTVPPEKVKNKITNRGIYFGDAKYDWPVLRRFWFQKSLNSQMVLFETNLKLPRQIGLVINPSDQDKIKEIVVKKIPLLQSSPTFIDKLTKWFLVRLPLENREKEKTETK